MENEVSKGYLQNAIEELNKDIGVKKEVDSNEIISKIEEGNTKEAVDLISQQLDLPVKLNILKVPEGYSPPKSEDINFQSTDLTRVKSHKNKKGTEGITAQVEIPGNLPNYGSTRLIDFPIRVKISESSTKHPFSFATVVAHELAHILLYSQNRDYKDNEFYTDLAILMLGFRDVYNKGREVSETKSTRLENKIIHKTKTTTYGYLEEEQFEFAVKEIKSLLTQKIQERNRLLNRTKKVEKKLVSYKRSVYRFNKFLNYIETDYKGEISQKDMNKISSFFHSDFIDNLEQVIEKNEKKIEKLEGFCEDINHFDRRKMDRIESCFSKIDKIFHSIEEKRSSVNKKVRLLRKYVNFFKLAMVYMKSFLKFNSFFYWSY